MDEEFDPDRWYWDQRTQKALYPRHTGDTVEFVTVWHAEEVTDALDGGALVPLEDAGLSRDTTFDLLESFRTPERASEEGSEAERDGQDADDAGNAAADRERED